VYIPHIGGRVVKSPKAIPKKKTNMLHDNRRLISIFRNKMENHNYNTVRTFPKSIWKIRYRCKINTPNTQSHARSRVWLCTGTSIKSGGAKLVFGIHLKKKSMQTKYNKTKCCKHEKKKSTYYDLCYYL